MYNSPLMQVLETEHGFRNVILCPFLRKTTKRLDQSSAVTTVDILHDKTEFLFTLESKVKSSDKWRFRLVHQDHALSLDIGDLILRNHVRLLQDLDRARFLARKTEPKAPLLVGLMISKSLTDVDVDREGMTDAMCCESEPPVDPFGQRMDRRRARKGAPRAARSTVTSVEDRHAWPQRAD